ncbi:MAG TPA: nitroreductase family deazaflavin-dependent oxidoreductase [Caulobacterales bacterium]|nr:nitroreductase family deazaflavin-dependent oxidoreductase [Caulobacterales bacterium]
MANVSKHNWSTLPDWVEAHLALYRTDPEKARMWVAPVPGLPPVQTLLLTTVGAKSGQARTLPLIYGESGGNFLIVASRGGSEDHPAWYRNLLAHPDCEIQVGAKHYHVRARTATSAERPALWETMNEIWPSYAEYQSRTTREIPVVVLEPRQD